MRTSRIARSVLAMMWAAISITAKDGRDFSGHYWITTVSEQDNRVRVTLSLELANESGFDLSQAVIEVRDRERASPLLGRSAPITFWPRGRNVTVDESLVVTRQEYERWMRHRQPSVFVVYSDESGQTRELTAQVNDRPGK